MATAINTTYATDITLEYGVPQTFALKMFNGEYGKSVASKFPGGRVMFTAIDGRKLFVNDEGAGDIERALQEMRIAPGDFIQVTKIRHPHGGGHSYRVQRVPDADASDAREPAPDRSDPRLVGKLEKSIEMQRETKRAAPARTEAARSVTALKEENLQRDGFNAATPHQQLNGTTSFATALASPVSARPITATSAKLCGIMCSLIDAINEGAIYADRLNLGLNSEDLRALAITAYISVDRRDGGAR